MKGLVDNDWHENVRAALDLVREEVIKATQQIEKSGGAEMSKGNRVLARKALEYLDKLDAFMIEVEVIGEKWDGLQRQIMGDVPGVQAIVLPTKTRTKVGGYARTVKEVAPWTNFTASIDGGELISEKTAKAGFAKALACFDLKKIADLGVMINGEPLVSKDKSAFKKYPQSVAHAKDGWHINTYCSTSKKVSVLREFAKVFRVKVDINVIPHRQSQVKVPTKAIVPLTERSRKIEGIPYSVGTVVQVLFPVVFKRRLVTAREVEELQNVDSASRFRTGGNAVLKPNRGNDNDRYRQTANGKTYARYYKASKVDLAFQGRRYYLTSQFSPEAIVPVVNWLKEKGIGKDEICRLIEEAKVSKEEPSLF